MMASESSPKSGRYAPVGGLASIDLPREGRRAGGKIEIVHGVAPDPYFAGDGEERGRGKAKVVRQRQQRVAINRKSDALELELSYRRISQAAYDAGRKYQRVMEAARQGLGGSSFEQSSGGGDHEAAISGKLDRAAVLVAWNFSIRSITGQWCALIIDLAVDDRLSLDEISKRFGYRSRWGRAKVGHLFRDALEQIALEWERKGFPEA